jgi:hypothetical protein
MRPPRNIYLDYNYDSFRKLGITQQHSLDSTNAAISAFNDFQKQQAILNEKLLDSPRMPVMHSQRPTGPLKDQPPNLPVHRQETVENAATGTTSSYGRNSDTAHSGSHNNVEPSSSLRIDSPKAIHESNIQPVSVRATTVYQRNMRFIKVTLWLGPLFVQHWHQGRQPAFGPLPLNQGRGVGISFAFPSSQLKKVICAISFWRKFNQFRMSTSIHWNLSLPAVVGKDSEIMEFALLGNLEAMTRLFRSGKASPTDIAPDGGSLVHVRSSGYPGDLF